MKNNKLIGIREIRMQKAFQGTIKELAKRLRVSNSRIAIRDVIKLNTEKVILKSGDTIIFINPL